MDIDALRYFAAAAKEEHFGPAADSIRRRNSGCCKGPRRCYRTFGLSWARGPYLPQGTAAFRDFLVESRQHRERAARVKTA